MAFQTNYDNTFSLADPGTYEGIVHGAKIALGKDGTSEYLSIPLVVRNDVQQPAHNKILWYAIRKKNTPTAQDNACDGYSAAQINTLSRAAQLPNGKSYGSLLEWLGDLEGKPIRMPVGHREYNGKTQYDFGYPEATKFPECRHVMKQSGNGNVIPSGPLAGYTQVDNEELPF